MRGVDLAVSATASDEFTITPDDIAGPVVLADLSLPRDIDDAVAEIDGVEQLTRYLELLNRDPLLAPVKGVFAAQEIKPQARVLAGDRGIDCVTVDYAVLKGTDYPTQRLF